MEKNNAKNIQEKKLRDIISKEIKKVYSETDLVAPDGQSWLNMKGEFKGLVASLLTNIERDDYNDAEGGIDKVMRILKAWKVKIDKGLNDGFVDSSPTATP